MDMRPLPVNKIGKESIEFIFDFYYSLNPERLEIF
jgi:hypothetical protein